jgi:multidrug efflux system membrane fusion protein
MDELGAPLLDHPRTRPGTRPARRGARILPWVILLVVLGIVGLLILRLGDGGGGRHAIATPPQAVGVATATIADMQVIDTGLGTVTSLASVTVQTQIAGVVQTIGFHEGQIVHQGDFLAQIDPRPYQALLDQAKGTLAHDQGLLRQAQTDEIRYQRLNKQDSIGRQQYEDQVFVVQQYQGSVAADQGAVETQMVNLAFCHITSPITGRVGLRQVDAGNYITTSLANGIVVVTQLDPISVIFTLPEDQVPAVQAQLAAGAKLQVVAYDRSNTVQLGTGTLETIDNQIDTTTGTLKMRALFANPTFTLFPNQFVNIRLIVTTVRGALTVPNAALQTGAPGSFVYAVQPDGTVAVKVVKLGIADADKTQITSGLNAGDRVVVDGADRLRDGAHVTVPGPQPPGAPATGTAPAHKHRHQNADSAN